MPLALASCAVALACAVVASCGREAVIAADDHRCATSIRAYCAESPGDCPPSPQGDRWCAWLATRGEASYGGPVDCTGLGTGWQVENGDGAAVDYLFDDAGSLVAILDERRCRAGPASLSDWICENLLVASGCPFDGGPTDAARDAGSD